MKIYDIVLLGATGFTATQCLRYLQLGAGRELKRWAVAGRSRAKLEAVVHSYRAAAPDFVPPEIVEVDLADEHSVAACVVQARVVLQLAGPYSETGTAVVKACAEQGVHYLDLSGEPFWVQQLIAQFDATARETGAKIIPVAGYEALPFDLGVLSAVSMSAAPVREVRAIVRMTGSAIKSLKDALSGGTVATLRVTLLNDYSDCFTDAACLVDDASAQTLRAANAINFSAELDPHTQSWTAPSVPGPFITPPVVLRSAALAARAGRPYSRAQSFRYHEALEVKSVLPPALRSPFQQRIAAQAMAAGFRAMKRLMQRKGGRSRAAIERVLRVVAPKSGQGPSENALETSGYEIDFYALAEDASQLTVRCTAAGHPGYRSTANLVIEAALALAFDQASLPAVSGLITPAIAFHDKLFERLERAGLRYVRLQAPAPSNGL